MSIQSLSILAGKEASTLRRVPYNLSQEERPALCAEALTHGNLKVRAQGLFSQHR